MESSICRRWKTRRYVFLLTFTVRSQTKNTDRIIQNILDMGTGTGIWAMYAHPEASVKGIDLSPIQPSWIPPNLKFEVDDYNLDWLDENKYDLVHARELLGTVPNWVEMYRKVLGYVKNHERKP